MAEAPYKGRILNVSVMGGFAYGDTSKNGLSVIVTADRDARELGDALAREIAELGWRNREQFRAKLTSLGDATRIALAASHDAALPARCFADVADNPGGGARGNTMGILEAFHNAGVTNALAGVVNDPALAADAHRLGIGRSFTARFNRDETSEFSRPFAAQATVRALSDGKVTGRRGIFADTRIDLGPTAAIDLRGITVVVITQRTQCADPIFFEHLGLDIGKARVVVVKSRGHFRGGFDEFFAHDQIVEVDCPGLTSPILTRFAWARLPRPVLPIDENVSWSAAGMTRLADLPTPCLVLDRSRLMRNIDAMARAVKRTGVKLRPHMKTAKSADVARLTTTGQAGGITVSTLAEAEYFAAHGFRDILYAVGIGAGEARPCGGAARQGRRPHPSHRRRRGGHRDRGASRRPSCAGRGRLRRASRRHGGRQRRAARRRPRARQGLRRRG